MMKIPFYEKFLAVVLGLILLASVVSSLPGCATMSRHSAAVELIVSQAVMRYIESASPMQRLERAHSVLRVSEKILQHASGESISLADLARIATESLPDTLTPADRHLALSVIAVANQELQARYGTTAIDANALTSVKRVIASIRSAAQIYTGD